MSLDLRSKNKHLESLELKSRELNLIIDGMFEIPNENTFNYVCSLLFKFIPHFDSSMIEHAYRLGNYHPKKPSRRILITTKSCSAREWILDHANSIADAGLPGARIFINEDIPETIKRRRSDIYKYIQFLKEKGVQATQSNLFPAPMKRTGIVYPSAEHAVQHAKAVYCKEFSLAQSILDNPCPFEAMATGKRVPHNAKWQSIQLQAIEEILRMKLEQVPEFTAELKSTANHILVENTRSLFWGSGTPYNSPSIFCVQFPGKNHLGRLLSHIRDNY